MYAAMYVKTAARCSDDCKRERLHPHPEPEAFYDELVMEISEHGEGESGARHKSKWLPGFPSHIKQEVSRPPVGRAASVRCRRLCGKAAAWSRQAHALSFRIKTLPDSIDRLDKAL